MAEMTLKDVALRLQSSLPGGAWNANYSSGPEAWLTNGENDIGLFQEEGYVRVVVWVGSDLRSLQVASQEKLAYLPEWLTPRKRTRPKGI